MKILKCGGCGTEFNETKTECPKCSECENFSVVIEVDWIVYFDKVKAIRPKEFKVFIENITEFVRLFPLPSCYITVNDLEAVLTGVNQTPAALCVKGVKESKSEPDESSSAAVNQ